MAFVGLAGILVALVGLISILIPLRFVGIKSRGAGGLVATAGFVIFIVALVASPVPAPEPVREAAPLGPASAPPPQTAAPEPVPEPVPQPSPAERAAAAMPDAQRAFITAVERGRAAYRGGTNDMQKGAARPARARELCSALPSNSVRDWVGQIASLSSNSDGKGVLSIRIARDTYVRTWNNELSDIADETLIDPASPVFAKALALEEGQWVTFSGSFRPAPPDCIREMSMTLNGSMTEPEFIFRFTGINPIRM